MSTLWSVELNASNINLGIHGAWYCDDECIIWGYVAYEQFFAWWIWLTAGALAFSFPFLLFVFSCISVISSRLFLILLENRLVYLNHHKHASSCQTYSLSHRLIWSFFNFNFYIHFLNNEFKVWFMSLSSLDEIFWNFFTSLRTLLIMWYLINGYQTRSIDVGCNAQEDLLHKLGCHPFLSTHSSSSISHTHQHIYLLN